jgi:hypothetical protein
MRPCTSVHAKRLALLQAFRGSTGLPSATVAAHQMRVGSVDETENQVLLHVFGISEHSSGEQMREREREREKER